MKPPELLDLLREFAAEKTALKRRHEAGARLVHEYDFNNTYQYVIVREETHLEWLGRAITELGGEIPAAAALPLPSEVKGQDAQAGIIRDDVRLMQMFFERWRQRIEQVSDSRHKLMLRVILGEMLEQQRFFEQAAAGRHDLLGRRTSPSEASGRVMSTRWVE